MTLGSRSKGFTLVEIVIVIAIIGILAAVAFPAYFDSVENARRAESKSALLLVAQAQERHFTQWGRYADTLLSPAIPAVASATNLGWAGSTVGAVRNIFSDDDNFMISLPAVIPPNAATAYTLTATVVNPANIDPICGNLTLNNIGTRGFTNPAGTPRQCW